MIVLDTHVLLWWISSSELLSPRAKRAIASAARKQSVIASNISVLEIATAVRRGRLTLSQPLPQWLGDVRSLPELRFEPVTIDLASSAGGFDNSIHRGPADRLILATALTLGARLVSADQRLRENQQVEIVW